jgi:hypothetical protein
LCGPSFILENLPLTFPLTQALLLYAAMLEMVGGSEALGSARRALLALQESKFLLHIYADLRAVLLGKLVRGTVRGLQAHGHVLPSAEKADAQVRRCESNMDSQAPALIFDTTELRASGRAVHSLHSPTHYARTSHPRMLALASSSAKTRGFSVLCSPRVALSAH